MRYMRKSSWVLLLSIILIGVGIWSNQSHAEGEGTGTVKISDEEAPRIGYMAPSFVLEDINGQQTYQVGGKREKVLFLNFWASWCGPCQEEAPDLVKLYAKYKSDLDMYSVNVTSSGDTLAKARSFVEEHAMINPVIMDTNGKVFESYNGIAFPTNFIIDKQGVVREVFIGMRSSKQLERLIQQLIQE